MSVEEITKEHEKKPLPPPWDRIFSLGTRLFVWTLFFGILYLLRPFLLTIFLTFVAAYVLAHGVDGLAHRVKSRTARVVLVFTVMVGTITATGLFLAPRIQQQAVALQASLPEILREADKEIHVAKTEYPLLGRLLGEQPKPKKGKGGDGASEPGGEAGPIPSDATPKDPASQGPASKDPVPQAPVPQDPVVPGAAGPADAEPGEPEEVKPYVSDFVRALLLGEDEEAPETVSASHAVDKLLKVATPVLGVTSAFFLSLLFSFLIVLDLPNVSRGIAGLKHTKIGFIYDEVADNVRNFGQVLGRALEAQLFVAICNTVLTAIGMYFMGLENLVFLSAIVFLCSFIPVAGVFISSAPICLIALQQEGFGLMIVAIVLILAIHFVEAYFLNPRIFGHHMHMNPVFVLIVLTIGGKLFGVWGLVLGLPLVNYVFRHAIRHRPAGAGDGEEPEGGPPTDPVPA